MESLVSIIVPIYNAERFLHRCVDSVLSQTVPDFELLLVNDGSSDSSLDICNHYAAKDSRIKVLDKPNGGVSSARNLAIKRASGKYLMFLDADDSLEANAIEVCLPYIHEYDFIKFGAKEFSANGVRNLSVGEVNSHEDIELAMILRTTIVAIWGAMISKRLFDKYHIRFDEKLTCGEDWYVNAQIVAHTKAIKFLPDVYAYNYDKTNENSCTNNLTFSKIHQQYYIVNKVYKLFGRKHKAERRLIKIYTTSHLSWVFGVKKSAKLLSEAGCLYNKIKLDDIKKTQDLDPGMRERVWKVVEYTYHFKRKSWLRLLHIKY